MKELYVGYDSNVLMLDEVLNRTIQDILGLAGRIQRGFRQRCTP